VHNPVDMIASANEISYRQALQWVLQDDNVDAVLVIFVPPIMINASAVADAIVEVNRRYKDKTVLACFMAQREAISAIEQLKTGRIPVYSFPEPAVQALAAMHQYRCWRDKPDSLPVNFNVDRDRVAKIIAEQQAAGRDYLDWNATHAVLDAYGFPVASSRVVPVGAVTEALEFHQRIHHPIVAKMIGQKLVHKSDIGGVKVDLRNRSDIENAFADFDRAIAQHQITADGILLQEMVKGRELVMGMHLDKDFGPLVMFGLGGVYVEVLKDISFNIAPLNLSEAQEMVESIRGYPMLKGVRGESAVDFDAIYQTLLRLSQLVTDHTEIIEMDINPFMAMSEKGRSVVADARIRLSNSFVKK
jgi:acetyltransferase